MTSSDHILATLPVKRTFHDAHEERSYRRTVETARRLLDDHTLLERGRDHLERFVRPDPRQAAYYRLWCDTLAQGAVEVARRLLEDSERGLLLRSSSPVFVCFQPDELKAMWSSPSSR